MTLPFILRKAWIWGPLVLYGYGIYYFSSLTSIPWASVYPDYLEHGVEYFGLAVLVSRALNDGLLNPVPTKILALAFALCVAYAISDELHQMYVPDRFADYRDVLSDATGAALGLLALLGWRRLLYRADAA